jgi:hypothetical protein
MLDFKYANFLWAAFTFTNQISLIFRETHFRSDAGEQSTMICWSTSYLKPSSEEQLKDTHRFLKQGLIIFYKEQQQTCILKMFKCVYLSTT